MGRAPAVRAGGRLPLQLYDPWVGVWLTQEPLPGEAWQPRTWHRYAYAFASPVSYYDAYGMQVPPIECKPGEICYTGTLGLYTLQSLPSYTPMVPPSMPTGASYCYSGPLP